MTYDRNSLSGLNISRYTKNGELPALIGVKEIAIGQPDVASGRRTRSAAQHELVAHELAIVLAQRAGLEPVARIGPIRALRPLPDITEHLTQFVSFCCVRRYRLQAFAVDKVAFHGQFSALDLPLRWPAVRQPNGRTHRLHRN